jgi:hypothetical protein
MQVAVTTDAHELPLQVMTALLNSRHCCACQHQQVKAHNAANNEQVPIQWPHVSWLSSAAAPMPLALASAVYHYSNPGPVPEQDWVYCPCPS